MSLLFFFLQSYNLGFSDSDWSSILDWFHNFTYCLLLGVLIFISLLFIFLIFSTFTFKDYDMEYQRGEMWCSVIPCIILLIMVYPSLLVLFCLGWMTNDSYFTIKVLGHQWYWSYDYSDIPGLEFDSYMKSLDSLVLGDQRYLDVDNRCVVPHMISLRICVSSADVLHAWSVTGLGIKLDAMSGIISVIGYYFPSMGVYYGQCSEICGANHSFMPIVVESTGYSMFKDWCIISS